MKGFEVNGVTIEWVHHATFRIGWKDLVVYIDPYVPHEARKADMVFITHDHFDHCDIDRLKEIYEEGKTVVFASVSCKDKLKSFDAYFVEPGDVIDYKGITAEVVPAYNKNKPYHPREKKYVGYVIRFGRTSVYHAGDTDFIDEMGNINTTVALLPIGGTYTMDVEEAAEAANTIGAEYTIPMHYNWLEGLERDPRIFKELVETSEVVIPEPLARKA